MSGDGMEHGTGRSAGQKSPRVLLALILGCALSGCSSVNPINWYRDATGISANDPAPDAPNAAALEAGGDKPYPNLGSVPPPPTRALSTAAREQLTQQLIADRANARYIDEQLRAGPGPSVPPPGAAPAPPPLGQRAEAARKPPEPAPAAEQAPAAAPVPAVQRGNALAPPPAAPPSPPSAAPQQASAPPAAAPAPPPRSSIVSLNAPDPSSSSPSSSSPSSSSPGPSSAPAAQAKPAAPAMVSPSVRSVPEPETPRAPPPPPSLAAARPSAKEPPAAPPRVAARSPAAVAVAGTALGRVGFAPSSAKLNPGDRQAIEAAARAQRESGSLLRVVGHAGSGNDSPTQQLAAFRIALDRANAVAVALTQAGVPTDQILLETAPSEAGAGAANLAEIFLGN
jgi:outer membrane protein OmpA-like peptidoglycan-associated protein